MYIVNTKGSIRVLRYGADKLSEAFRKNEFPPTGSVCALIGQLDESDDELLLYGFAVAKSHGGVAAGTVRATLSPVFVLEEAVGLDDLGEQIASFSNVPGEYSAQAMPRAEAVEFLQYLNETGTHKGHEAGEWSREDEDEEEDVASWLIRSLGTPRTFTAEIEQARTEARDAVTLAAQIANVNLPANAFTVPKVEQDNETILDTIVNKAFQRDLEEELMPLDLQRFDGKLVANQRAASLTVFEDADRKKRLIVMSVNKKPLEEELGIDLLYWDQTHDAFTFVQYKRLEKDEAPGENGLREWVYRRKSELVKQLKLMPSKVEEATSVEDWRAFGTPFWFKFVKGDAAKELDDKTLKGMYVPADWLRQAIKEGVLNTGKKKGFRVTYDNTKYVGRTTFTELVRRGFTGTGRKKTDAFMEIMETLGSDRELIVAYRTEWEDEAEEQQADRTDVLDTASADTQAELPF